MFDNLSQRLSLVVKRLRGEARLTDDNIQDALREVRLALLEADVALPVVKDFVAAVKEKAVGEEVIGSLTPGQALIGVVHRELAALMGGAAAPLDFAVQPPAVILLAGLQGAGKTTTAGKLAHLLRGQKKKVLLVSADVYRPAAIEQLAVLGAQVGADVFPSASGEAPVAIAAAALDWAKRHYHDMLIVDTAGRLAIDEAMMREITALHAAVKPIETLFVVDAMQGQDAVNTARAFRDALPLTGVILTKLDGDARGGAALSVRHVTGAPIKFAGVSEKIDGLEPFHAHGLTHQVEGQTVGSARRRDLEPNVPPPTPVEAEAVDPIAAGAEVSRHARMCREHFGLVRHPAFQPERCALHRTAGRGLNLHGPHARIERASRPRLLNERGSVDTVVRRNGRESGERRSRAPR
jgi:signal recognition particle subunit SRP54